jgi:hypothetical protein
MKKLSLSTKLYMVGGLSLLLIFLFRVFSADPPPQEGSSLFGAIQLKADSSSLTLVREEEERKEKEGELRYKVQVKKENPFLALYKEEKPVATPPREKIHKPAAKKKQEKGFFSVSNPELTGKVKKYRAVFREGQAIIPGKALEIILKEPIPALRLNTETKLTGIPRLSGEDRILINITVGVIGSEDREVLLTCYDPGDPEEGLFYDRSSYQLEDEIKESLVDELLDVDFKGRDLIKKGVAISRKYKNKRVEKWREIRVGIAAKEAKNGYFN